MNARSSMFVLLMLGSLMLLGRLGLEVGTYLIEKRAALAPWLALGATLVMAFSVFTVVAGGLLFSRPRHATQRGSATVTLMAVLALVFVPAMLACSSCAGVKQQGRAIGSDVVDCTTPKITELDKQFGPLADKVLQLATGGDGSLDFTTVKEIGAPMAIDIGRCVLARAVARLLKPHELDPNAPQSAGLEVDRTQLLSSWRQYTDGRAYHTPDGDL